MLSECKGTRSPEETVGVASSRTSLKVSLHERETEWAKAPVTVGQLMTAPELLGLRIGVWNRRILSCSFIKCVDTSQRVIFIPTRGLDGKSSVLGTKRVESGPRSLQPNVAERSTTLVV